MAEKGENAGNQYNVFSPTMFSSFSKTNPSIQPNLICCLQMLSLWASLNPLPNDKMSDWSKFKACADDKISVT